MSDPQNNLPGPAAQAERTIDLETVSEAASPAGEAATLGPQVSGSSSAPQIPDFEMLEVLGQGGMGVVYKARQISLKRLVAIKMILAGGRARPEMMSRFQQEAEAVARLHHPNIVQIFAIGEHDGCSYLALEYTDGGSLDKALARQPQPGPVAARLVETLARAIHHAHQHQVVHRDLKPSNVLLQLPDSGSRGPAQPAGSLLERAIPKVTDFGLAKQLDSDSGQTQSGAILGTPSYMAPEQAAGDLERVGPAADVYALGAILYEMLTGQPPFRGSTPIETVSQVLTQDVTAPSKLVPRVERDLETICLKALAKDPKQRYSSALTLAQDLERFGAGEPILARREGPVRRMWRKLRRRKLTAVSVLAILLAMIAGGFFAWEFTHARQARSIAREFNEGLKARDWPIEHLENMEVLLTSLDHLAPEEAANARHKLYQRYADALIESSRQEGLGPDGLAQIEKSIADFLAPRDRDLADIVRREIRTQFADNAKKAIEARLPKIELKAGYLDDMERLIAEVMPVYPDRARQARTELHAGYEKLVRHELRPQTALTLQDFERIKTAVGHLKKHNPDLERTLQALAEKRKSVLQTIRTVEFPFDDVEKTLKAKWAKKGARFVLSPVGGNPDNPVVLLDDDCRGNVQMEATFVYPNWGTAKQLGLAFDVSPDKKRGYSFLIGVAPSKTSATLELARTEPRLVNLKILRNGITLRQDVLKVFLAGKAMTLRATREGSALTFELLQAKALPLATLRFQDMLATSSVTPGVFALHWPRGVGLESLRLSRQSLPSEPGPLERADHFLATGDVDSAFTVYRKEGQDSQLDLQVRQEARCKEALCLIELKRPGDAAEVLESLVRELTDKGERWPLVASCELWLLYLRQNRRADADSLVDTLISRGFKHDQLAAVISEDARRAISTFFGEEFSAFNFVLRPSDKRLRSLERLVDLQNFLRDDKLAGSNLHWVLSRSYRVLGQSEKALRMMEARLREDPDANEHRHVLCVEEFSSVCREMRDPQRGLAAINLHMRIGPGSNSPHIRLLIERARVHVALGNWQQAERELDQYFETVQTQGDQYVTFSAACLMRGFLRERLKDEAGAQAAWRMKHVPPAGSTEASADPTAVFGNRGAAVIHALILASLTNQLTDARANQFQELLIGFLPTEYQAGAALGLRLSPELLRDMWQSPRGMEAARHLAYQDIPLADYLKLPAIVTGAAWLRRDGLPPGPVSAEQEELVWRLCDDIMAAIHAGTLSQANMVQMALSWKGTTNVFGWSGLSSVLQKQPSLRGPLAYVMAHRLLRLGQPPEKALELFRTAHADAGPGTPLSRLAETELKRLKGK